MVDDRDLLCRTQRSGQARLVGKRHHHLEMIPRLLPSSLYAGLLALLFAVLKLFEVVIQTIEALLAESKGFRHPIGRLH
jgi:hypothetical protein